MAEQRKKRAKDEFQTEAEMLKRKRIKTAALWIVIAAAMIFGLLLMFVNPDSAEQTATAPQNTVIYLVPGQQTDATAAPETTLYYGLSAQTVPTLPQTTAAQPITLQPPQTASSAPVTTAAPAATTAPPITSANGTLNVDGSAENKFIKIVNQQYGIDAELLTAVFALPDTGQNYVLEWNSGRDDAGKILHTAENLRRCYLINTAGEVTDIAATKSSERVGMSIAENRIAMETLIKRVILPQIAAAIG
ncbi:MAG: hypothetical protein IJ766_09425 [Clostridia bacterium]|nr:hypothetical protein [Clostridia bacterium]